MILTPNVSIKLLNKTLTLFTFPLKREWNELFTISILICVLAIMFYTFFAAGELQIWVSNSADEYQHVLNNPISSQNISERSGLNEKNIGDLTDRLQVEIHDKNNAE
ncbi:unnamed protein product [Rotaria magnacalcarata]|uniref:Uncharacterized protein n=1 Tax=Rotaria magnacalcarata TaxID=392030 RepID=A0A816D938_9BILA|nr:unnamed protein product [Rotaria magnacalcarata]